MEAWGVDYGTTTSLWVEYLNGQFVDQSYPLCSSVYWSKDKGLLFGNDAYCLQDKKGSGYYIRSPKRFLDKECMENWPLGLNLTVDEVVIKFFMHMFNQRRECIQDKTLDKTSTTPYITLTVPNSFKDKQYMGMRWAVLEAAKRCNKFEFDQECFDIIPEPVAAALCYAHMRMCANTMPPQCNIIVCDIGGGTTDVAVVRCIKKDVPNGKPELSFEVLCTSPYGNGLGGDVFDSRLVDYLTDNGSRYKTTPGYILSYLAKVLKGYLSDTTNAKIPLINADWDIVCDNRNRAIQLSCTREKFEQIIERHLVELKNILRGVHSEFEEVYHEDNEENILLPVGGSSRIPKIKEMLSEIFNNAKMVESNNNFITYNSVVCGAAIYSAWRIGQQNDFPYSKLFIVNRTPHKYTIEHSNGEFCEVVSRNAPDGIYDAEFVPIKLDDDGTFTIGKLTVYQGEGTLSIHSADREVVLEQELTDTLYSHGRPRENINLKVSLEIKSSRLNSIKFVAEGCTQDGQDYIKLIDVNQM